MRNFIILFLLVFCSTNVFADSIYQTEEEYTTGKIIQDLYTKEANIYYAYDYIIKKFPEQSELNEILTAHQQHINALKTIMKKLEINIPNVNKVNRSVKITNISEVCENGLMLEKELSSTYNDSIKQLQALGNTDMVNSLSLLLSELSDTDYYENSRFFKRCAGRI